MCFIITFFLLSFAVTLEGYAVKITKLVVPEVIKMGKQVVLDCDYTLDDSDGLVVKWYFNEKPIYQWISSRQPQGFGK